MPREPRPATSRAERAQMQRSYAMRAALLGIPALAFAAYVLFRMAWWLPFALAGVCGLLVAARMLWEPRQVRLDLRR